MFIGCHRPSLTGNWFYFLIAIDVNPIPDLICQRNRFTDRALQIRRFKRGVQDGSQLIAQLSRPSVEIGCTVSYVRSMGKHILRCVRGGERQTCVREGALDISRVFPVE